MNSRQAALVVILGVVAIGIATGPVGGADAPQATNQTGENETETKMGAQLTAFMQASAAETNDTVESGMWKAEFEQANESEQAQLATDRATRLERQVERLRERNQTLQQRYENGEIPEPAYIAQTSQIAGQINALQNSINDTATAAEQADIDSAPVERLKEQARNITAPEVPGVSTDLSTGKQGPPEERGPPDDAGNGNGPPTDGTESTAGPQSPTGNRTDAGEADNGTEPPAAAGENQTVSPPTEGIASGNNTTGPPTDVGEGDNNTTGPPPANESESGGGESDRPNEGSGETRSGSGTPEQHNDTETNFSETTDGESAGPSEQDSADDNASDAPAENASGEPDQSDQEASDPDAENASGQSGGNETGGQQQDDNPGNGP